MNKLVSFLLMIFCCTVALFLLTQVFSAANSFAALLYFVSFVFMAKIGFYFIEGSFK